MTDATQCPVHLVLGTMRSIRFVPKRPIDPWQAEVPGYTVTLYHCPFCFTPLGARAVESHVPIDRYLDTDR